MAVKNGRALAVLALVVLVALGLTSQRGSDTMAVVSQGLQSKAKRLIAGGSSGGANEDDEGGDAYGGEEGEPAPRSGPFENADVDDSATNLDDDVEPGTVVNKKIIWEKTRIVFVAGLAHAGHSAWKDALKKVCPPGRCETTCQLADQNLWFPELLIDHNARVKRTKMEFAAIIKSIDPAKDEKTYFVNLFPRAGCDNHPSSHLEYPTEDNFRADRIPDLHLMAALAEEAGVDLRVVVIDEDEDVLVRGAAWTAQFTSYNSQAILKTMEQAYQSMYTQLVQVERGFFLGVNMDKIQSNGELDAFVGIKGLEQALAASAETWRSEIKAVRAAATPLPGAEAYRFELELARDKVRNRLFPGTVSRPLIVKKTVFSKVGHTRPRLVFVAGLEGTGHHLWRLVTTKLMQEGKLIPACPIERHLFQNRNKNTMWFTQYADLYQTATEGLVRELRALVELDAGAGRTYMANLMDSSPECYIRAGMMSYPNFKGRFKTLQRPNVITLAKLTDEAGIDLRIIVLLRDGDGIIRSTVDHRHFGGWGPEGEPHEIRFLSVNVHALYAQMDSIDNAFFSYCDDFDDPSFKGIETLSTAFNISSFPDLMRSTAQFPPPPPPNKLVKWAKSSKRRNSLAFTLKTTLSGLESFCPNAELLSNDN